LVVYGGIGRAARNWECYDQIVESLTHLNDDETLLVQSGKPVGVFKTHRIRERARSHICFVVSTNSVSCPSHQFVTKCPSVAQNPAVVTNLSRSKTPPQEIS